MTSSSLGQKRTVLVTAVVTMLGLILTSCGSPDEPGGAHRIRLAYVSVTGGLHVVDPDGTHDSVVTSRTVLQMASSTTSGLFAYYADPSIYVLDIRTKKEIIVASIESDFGRSPLQAMEWSPDGVTLMYVSGSLMHIVNADGTGVHVLTPPVGGDVTWSPDGQRLAYENGNGIWTIGVGGNSVHQLSTAFGERLRWSPDGKFIAGGGGDIRLFPLDGSDVRAVIAAPCQPQCGPSVYFELPYWSNDGTMIAATSGPAMFAVNTDGTGLHTLIPLQLGNPAVLPQTSPTEPVIAYLDGTRLKTIRFDGTGANDFPVRTGVSEVRWTATR